jgi:hypothetical protein
LETVGGEEADRRRQQRQVVVKTEGRGQQHADRRRRGLERMVGAAMP